MLNNEEMAWAAQWVFSNDIVHFSLLLSSAYYTIVKAAVETIMLQTHEIGAWMHDKPLQAAHILQLGNSLVQLCQEDCN